MEMRIVATLHLPDEEININIWGKLKDGRPSVAEAYNKAKETIITAEEERRIKIIASKDAHGSSIKDKTKEDKS